MNRTAPALLDELLELRDGVVHDAQERMKHWRPFVKRPRVMADLENLAAYLALRRHDLRDVQRALPRYGLSSLGRIEAHVIENLDAVIVALGAMTNRINGPLPIRPTSAAFLRGQRSLSSASRALFGPASDKHDARIMVTLGIDVIPDDRAAVELLERGVNVVRINCAHDDAAAWRAMVERIRSAEQTSGRRCKIMMDIAGPKLRTGSFVTSKNAPRLHVGDVIRLVTPRPLPQRSKTMIVVCESPAIIAQAAVGHEIWLDDGRLVTQVTDRSDDSLSLVVRRAPEKGFRMKRGRGLNMPGVDVRVDPLTDKDRRDLDVVAQLADMVGFSFVQHPDDIDQLDRELSARTRRRIGIVAKIETRLGVQHLPDIIARSVGVRPTSVMIARGDLAVELGYERISEMQEEILWVCEAAAIPVIWATQVLESFVKTGIPSRAEITDAAMSGRAECVMLNKGLHIPDAVTILDHVLTRMQGHQHKKSARLRELRSW